MPLVLDECTDSHAPLIPAPQVFTDVAGTDKAGTDGAGERIDRLTMDRELSWLQFNGRVLQEAADPSVPVFERLAFLGIFSSNLEEFFRVRVASLRSLLRLEKKKVKRLPIDPETLLSAIYDVERFQHEWFVRLLGDEILPALDKKGVSLLLPHQLSAEQREAATEHFNSEIRARVEPVFIAPGLPTPFLDSALGYLAVELFQPGPIRFSPAVSEVALIPIPSPPLDRFIELPAHGGKVGVMFIDDVIRMHLSELFPGRKACQAWAVQMSRDAELDLENKFRGDIVEAMRTCLTRRHSGPLTRVLHDQAAPMTLMSFLKREVGLREEDLIPGTRYPNLHDLQKFPRGVVEDESFPEWSPVPHPEIDESRSVREVVAERDQLLHFPYQSYDHVVRFLTEAAMDPDVEEIRLTVYRVSAESAVLRALIAAAEEGKDVRVFVEVKARFDEKSNLEWAERLEAVGIVTDFSSPTLKVHAKIALVVRRENGERRRYACLGTGNFNETTAQVYADMALLTADPEITREVQRVFHVLEGLEEDDPVFDHLMVSPYDLREKLEGMIRGEIERAERGEEARITFKMNALEDPDIIDLLYDAADAGVQVKGVVRGICCMTPDADVCGDRLHLRSIVDRYLEHARAWVFHCGGDPEVFLSSSDWMHRNLDHRVEVAFPIRDPRCREQVFKLLEIQLADDRKARLLQANDWNSRAPNGGTPVRSQEAFRDWLADLADRERTF